MICSECNEFKPLEKNGKCGTCNHIARRANRTKAFKPGPPIKKVSAERGRQNHIYSKIKAKVMLNAWCAYHGKPCIPTDIHHQMGRAGFADDKEIPLLIDARYMIPVCRQAHLWITEHSKEATEQGYSFSRIGKAIK